MIKNWEEHSLCMDFSGLTVGNAHPSDIDLFWIGKNHLVFGEIKNECGTFKEGQTKMFEKLVDGYNGKAIYLLITHNKYVQKGDKMVDVSVCPVIKYYYKGEWHTPRKLTTVKQIIDWA